MLLIYQPYFDLSSNVVLFYSILAFLHSVHHCWFHLQPHHLYARFSAVQQFQLVLSSQANGPL